MADKLTIPKFASETEEAQWWFGHRDEVTKANQRTICSYCGSSLEEKIIGHEEHRGNQLYLFQNVSAQLCAACGKLWINDSILQEIERLIERGESVGPLKTTVYDFSTQH